MRLWIAMIFAAVGLAAGTWWLTRSPAPERPAAPVSEQASQSRTVASSTPRPMSPSHPIRAWTSAVEPIAVHPETDVAVDPMPTPAVTTNLVRETSDRLVPRPEAGIEPVPFMPYADEEAELARLRRQTQGRLAEKQTDEPPLIRQVRELQETAEPPLNMPDRPATMWRPFGKLPCSVR
jgi:hypothetical protein